MNLRVLVINERDSFCSFLSSLLEAEGHVSLCARGFRDASRAATVLNPDLIVLEVSRPDIGALEIVQRLQRAAETRQIPIIVISDYPELEYELLDIFDFMVKPVDVDRLREDLKILVEGRKKRDRPLLIEPYTSNDHLLFYDYLITHSGLHFERRNLKILERGLAARMAALRIGSYREYFDYLSRHNQDRHELQKLLTFLTVGETYFFRYHAHFDALRKFLATELADKGKRIRLWSAGCSTGEEPYTLAMTVMEALPDWRERDIRILATDINNRSLKQAGEGVYTAWSMRVIEKRYLDRYFDKIGKSYIIRDEVKSLVDFSHLNLQTDQYPAPDGEFRDLDAIFCRNVMIYFSLPTTRQIVEKIADTLVPGGLLFLGHAETLFQISSRFERHSHGGGFYYREKKGRSALLSQKAAPVPAPAPAREKKGVTPLPVSVPKRAVPAPAPASVKPPREQDVEGLYKKAQTLFEEEKFQEAAELLGDVVRQQPDHTGALVLQGFVMANSGRFQEAITLCQKALAVNDLLPEAYFLEGLVLDMTDRLDEAVEAYRKTILLWMEFVMSHYFLGRLYFRLGRETDGARELRNTLKILEKGEKERVIPFSGGLSREVLLQQVRDELAKVA
ncbi:MAG TPA: CheR family methyltransferase [Geobacteraceae bacterium]|nr:CheR family methyltransferase [Geobacteraceae bacterium]